MLNEIIFLLYHLSQLSHGGSNAHVIVNALCLMTFRRNNISVLTNSQPQLTRCCVIDMADIVMVTVHNS